MALGSKKKKRDAASELTDDLLVEILSRVPYRTTCCCKCVYRRWRDVVSHPDHRKKLPQTLAGFFYETEDKGRFPRKARHFTSVSGGYAYHPCFDPSLSFLPKYKSLDILDCCNGLLLCHCSKGTDPNALHYVVCNPATGKWVAVPGTCWSGNGPITRLGFDPAVSSQFYVFEFITVCVPKDDTYYNHRINAVWIYSHNTGDWSYNVNGLGNDIRIHVGSKSIFFSGMLHWATDNLVVAIGVQGDDWRTIRIPTPPYLYNAGPNDIYLSEGQLCLANMTCLELSIWALEDSSTEKWALKHNARRSQLSFAFV
uniref:Uncharacterized protein n=1 Tax=Avena sativa TaxID=4498 RepID=A0ACD5XCV1_AVESA